MKNIPIINEKAAGIDVGSETHLLQLEDSEKTRMLYLWGFAGDEAGLKSEM